MVKKTGQPTRTIEVGRGVLVGGGAPENSHISYEAYFNLYSPNQNDIQRIERNKNKRLLSKSFQKKTPEEKFISDYLKLVKKHKLQLLPYIQLFQNNELITEPQKYKEVQDQINEFLNKKQLGLRADLMISKVPQNNGKNTQ